MRASVAFLEVLRQGVLCKRVCSLRGRFIYPPGKTQDIFQDISEKEVNDWWLLCFGGEQCPDGNSGLVGQFFCGKEGTETPSALHKVVLEKQQHTYHEPRTVLVKVLF
jgi:hypothetical protein